MNTVVSKSVSEVLAEQSARIATEKLAERAYHAFSRACIDFITCAVIGTSMPVTEASLRYFSKTDLGRQSSVIGRRERLSPASAAFITSASAHGLDLDDGHTRAGGHPGASVFPATFAMAEHLGSTSDEIIRAVVAGYNTMVRVATMMHPNSAKRGWHNTAVAGTFGATSAVAALLKLDAEKTTHALGLAGSFAGGLLEFLAEGPDVKRIHPGMAARDGIVCAGLAEEGLTGPTRVFEGPHGVFNAFISGTADVTKLYADTLEIGDIYFKLYPCCRHYHAAIDGVLDLKAEHGLDLKNVRQIRLGLYGVAVRGHDHKEADTMLGAQMSAPIAAALALVDGAVTVRGFEQPSLRRDEVRTAVQLVDVKVDEECEREYPKRRSGVVAIETTDGRVFEKRVMDPKGEGQNPLSDDDLNAKFRSNCAPIYGEAGAERALQLIWNFHRQPDSLSRLLAELTPKH